MQWTRFFSDLGCMVYAVMIVTLAALFAAYSVGFVIAVFSTAGNMLP